MAQRMRHVARSEAGIFAPPEGRRRRWLRWLGAALLALVVVLVLLAVGLLATALEMARGTPALSPLLERTQAQTTVIYDSSGKPIAELHGAVNRTIVPGAALPAALKEATIAVEDKRFYSDVHGLDPEGIARAALADLEAGRPVQGGSTITEQYVKNAFLGGVDDSFTLKLHEAILAWELSARWSRQRILTAYLNTIYYGDGAYGAAAAARAYFRKDVSHLSLAQAALLAGLPRDPSGYSPIFNPAAARARRNLVLGEMASQGYISEAAALRAKRSPLRVNRRPPAGVSAYAAYFVDYVEQQLVARYGARETFEGGLRVFTTLDARMQRDALAAMRRILPRGPAGALVSIEPQTGFIRAMTTTLDWSRVKFDLAWQAHRQLGSAMKPFALTAAVEEGANPATTYYDSMPLHLYLGPHAVPPYWNVSTFSRTYAGRINLVQATWQSDNTVFAQLALDLGPKRIVAVAHKMGIESRLAAYPSIVLGADVVDPLEVADAYATLADEGVRHAPTAIASIAFPDGRVWRARPRGRRVVPAGVAYVVDQILVGNCRYGTAAAMPSYYTGTAAGKTGTTSNDVDAWFCGFNPRLASVVWMGYPQAEVAMPGVQGATYCVPIWGTYYRLIFGRQAIPGFARPALMPQWRPWHGHYSLSAPPASPSPSATPTSSSSARPAPTPTHTAAPSSSPTPSPTPTVTPTAGAITRRLA